MSLIYGRSVSPDDEDNIIFAPEHSRRVHCVEILATSSCKKCSYCFAKTISCADQSGLGIGSSRFVSPHYRGAPVISGFLGGPTPRLRYLRLRNIFFPISNVSSVSLQPRHSQTQGNIPRAVN